MRLALGQARRALGRSFPNPAVGAVVYRGDRILGRGHTRPAGGPHAEVVAIERALRRHGAAAVRGASLAVTLEPCCHHGRTGPCTDRIRAAGIARVAVGHADPNPRVAGRGLRQLRRAGIRVTTGVLEDACRSQHRGFLSLQARGRPFVALKLAASLDGRIATAGGESRWISGPEARARVHALRDRADAVLVGSGTARADDPSLTVRRGDVVRRCPVRVVVDSRLAVPLDRQLFRDGHADRTWLLTRAGAPAARRRARLAAGARLVDVPGAPGALDLRAALAALGGLGISEVLVEGGAGLAAALLRAGLVDELHWFAAASLLGADGIAAVDRLGVQRLQDRIALELREVRRLGRDVYLRAAVSPRTGARGRKRR